MSQSFPDNWKTRSLYYSVVHLWGGVYKKPDARGQAAKFDIALYVMPPTDDTDRADKIKVGDQSVYHNRPARKFMRDYVEYQSSINNEGGDPWVENARKTVGRYVAKWARVLGQVGSIFCN